MIGLKADLKAMVAEFMGEFGLCADMEGIVHSLAIEDGEGKPIEEYLEKLLRKAYERGRSDQELYPRDGPLWGSYGD